MKLVHIVAALALVQASAHCLAQTQVTQDKVLAGNLTPGDAPGFPFTITQPGSYRLMGNLSVPAGTTGVLIAVAGVTLDLNGFSISGPGVCNQNTVTRAVSCVNGTFIGINAQGYANTVVRNGTVRGFNNGIAMGNEGLIENMLVTHNTASGIWSSSVAANVRVVDTRSVMNGGMGMFISAGSVLRSLAAQNGEDGILGSNVNDLLVMDSMATSNRVNGFRNLSLRGSMISGDGQSNRQMVRSLGGNADNLGAY